MRQKEHHDVFFNEKKQEIAMEVTWFAQHYRQPMQKGHPLHSLNRATISSCAIKRDAKIRKHISSGDHRHKYFLEKCWEKYLPLSSFHDLCHGRMSLHFS